MAAATVSKEIQTADPTREVVVLTASTTNTYVSRKFETVEAAIAQNNSSITPLKVSHSGATVTITGTGLASATVTLELWGRRK